MPVSRFEILSEIDLTERPKAVSSIDDIESYQTRAVQIVSNDKIIRSEVNLVEWLAALRELQSEYTAIGEEYSVHQNIAGESIVAQKVSHDVFRIGIWDIVNRKENFVELSPNDIAYLSGVIKSFIMELYGLSELQLSAVERIDTIF